ncbi:hypothetical protein IX299_002030 [Porphyromonas levii]|nr:hypothetical protein [Porphyromonas levii]
MTIIVSIIVIIALVFSIKNGGVLAIVVSSILVFFVVISVLLRPIKTIYSDGNIIVEFIIGRKLLLDANEYTHFLIEKYPIGKSVRIFANGGYFGYSGIWKMYIKKENKWFVVKSYATNKDHDVILFIPKTGRGKSILVNMDPKYF